MQICHCKFHSHIRMEIGTCGMSTSRAATRCTRARTHTHMHTWVEGLLVTLSLLYIWYLCL